MQQGAAAAALPTANPSSTSSSSRPLANNPYQSTQSRILAGTPPTYYPGPPASSHYPGASSAPRHRSLLDIGSSTMSASSSSNSPDPRHFHRILPQPPPRLQISEEDECPVCHRELPPRSLPDLEAMREAHVVACVSAHTSSTASPPRRTGMFPYLATEKDCVDSAECTICLEEFEVGVPMARLECLCRFHRGCITAWFVNHPGRCPVHQHDSFGY